MEYQNVIFEIKEECGLLTINRPPKMNALNWDTIEEIVTV